jgi:DNA-binding XRE family transcriptional regulator
LKGYFLPDDPGLSYVSTGDAELDALVKVVEEAISTSADKKEADAMAAHIRLNRDPEGLLHQERFARERLLDTLKAVRDNLELTQADFARAHGVNERTLRRLEHLDTQGAYLPHASTLRKLAALCRELRWEEHAETLEEAARWPRRHRFAPRGENRPQGVDNW